MKETKIYLNRKELYEAGLHNSHQKGIGRAKDGSENMSIVLSGGYEDDVDYGNEIIYTGEGGRDPRTGQQIANQELTRGNLALLKSYESGEPVYVIRGSGHASRYSPDYGYEFAGEYLITKHWIEKGRSGFDVVRFRLIKQNELIFEQPEQLLDKSPVSRIEYTSTRIIRDTKISKAVKDLYDYRCQVCGITINLSSGDKYAEGAHIKPLGRPHDGPDTFDNILCLCPNHHLMFDKYCYSINQDFSLEGLDGSLHVMPNHTLNKEYLNYHLSNYHTHQR